jgi:DNA polymerase I
MFGFREVVVIDFEFCARAGERPDPICLVAHELLSGRRIRMFQGELRSLRAPPYPIDRDALIVAYYASAELGCYLALDWELPTSVLDLYSEFRNLTNGRELQCGSGLLGASRYFGLDAIGTIEKDSMRNLAMRGGPWTLEEQAALVDYCESDVLALSKLLDRMMPGIDLARAILRGRYMVAAARIEHIGIPIDTDNLLKLRGNWTEIKQELIARTDKANIYESTTFKLQRWVEFVKTQGISWPILPSGQLDLSDDAFRLMAELHPAEVEDYRQLRFLLSQMRLEELAVGEDGRNRCLLSAFRAVTGRNQPSNTKFIFGPAVWLRSLIRPEPGYGLAYIDWAQQEFGIAAYLSGDDAMIAAYESGDPYLAFARQAGAIPVDGTKQTHGLIRERFKSCALGVLFGMGDKTLAQRIGQSTAHARELLRLHRETFPVFHRWSDRAVDYAILRGSISASFGWTLLVEPNCNPRTIRNFPMQGNGSEMLRLACCLATERGTRVCAPVHDALLIEARLEDLPDAVAATQEAMAEASALVLGGFRLRSDAEVFRYPDRFEDERGRTMWKTISKILADFENRKASV